MTTTPHPKAGSLRFRLTAVATLVVGVVLAVSAFAVLTVQRVQLTANLDASLQQRADLIASDLAANNSTAALFSNDEDRAVQLVGVGGRVLAVTANLEGQPALSNPLGTGQFEVVRTRSDLPLEDDAFRVLSRRIETSSGPAVLHVAENSDDLRDAIRNLTFAFLAMVPTVAVALGALIWWLTGRTLNPVDRMRAQVDAITATRSDQRLLISERNDEISRLGATMNLMLDRLTAASERQRRFVADAAHELRTPLTRIRTNLDVDLAQPESADSLATLKTIRQETIALQSLLDDLLYLARSDANESPRHREPVDLDDIVMQEIRDIRSTNQGLAVDASNVSAAHLEANPQHLRRVVRNLLTNAVHYAESTIVVELSEHAGVVELAISDDGPGVPEPMHEQIFERFARVQDSRSRDDGGSGLGLAIVRDIVEEHGGTIIYDASHHPGARFLTRFP